MNKIKAARKAKGLKQWQLAIEVNAYKDHISKIECGTRTPSVTLLRKIAKVLGVHVGDLID